MKLDRKDLLNKLYEDERLLEVTRANLEESKRTKWREEGLLTRTLESLKEKSRNAERILCLSFALVLH